MTLQSILDQLDHCADGAQFPVLDNGYIYPADVRLSVFRDDSDWLMVIETPGAYSPRTSGCASFQNCLHVYGGDEFLRPGISNANILLPIESVDEDPLFADEYDWNLRQEARSLEIRGRIVKFDPSPESLASKGIQLIEPPEIDPPAVLRSLLPEYRELLLASERDLAKRNPGRLPLWLRLEEWNHPDISAGVMPSEHPTFQMLARAIAMGDRSEYRPELLPNTAWWCWPEGGTMQGWHRFGGIYIHRRCLLSEPQLSLMLRWLSGQKGGHVWRRGIGNLRSFRCIGVSAFWRRERKGSTKS